MKYIYPCLGNGDMGFIKLNGPGLANMMIVAARAYCMHCHYGIEMINPTWGKLSIGPYLRHEKDKRHYFGLFNSYGIGGLRKLWAIHHVTHSEQTLQEFLDSNDYAVLKVEGLGNYFKDLDQSLCHDYFWNITSSQIKKNITERDCSHTVAMHIRLGDYSHEQRTNLDWYAKIIDAIRDIDKSIEILIFSDGRDDELGALLTHSNVKRSMGNNALEDILLISKCKLVVASHSTFSAMGAFIGHCPVVFPKRDFPPLYNDNEKELVISIINDNTIWQLSRLLNY